jgi:hypothetical protein
MIQDLLPLLWAGTSNFGVSCRFSVARKEDPLIEKDEPTTSPQQKSSSEVFLTVAS